MKKKYLILSGLAFALIIALSIGPAMAYFTTYKVADGSEPVNAGARTEIEETFDSTTKHVTLTNKSAKVSVYVRVKVFSTHPFEASGEHWNTVTKNNEFTYCDQLIPPGGTAAPLDVWIDFPKGFKEGESFNVLVMHECVPARYTDKGVPYADWSDEWIAMNAPKT